MTVLKPFFSYYGAKYRAARLYPIPTYKTVVEPFAGSAGYAVRHADRSVVLVERYNVVAEVWRWLIAATPDDVRKLPLKFDDVASVDAPQGARWLMGFWLSRGGSSPATAPSKWMREGKWPECFWGARVRERIASQVDAIKHWSVIEGSYEEATNIPATWFIDPPYQAKAGRSYRHNSLDFSALGDWCRTRVGQVIVCEGAGADWLPFEDVIGNTKVMSGAGRRGTFKEVAWIKDNQYEDAL